MQIFGPPWGPRSQMLNYFTHVYLYICCYIHEFVFSHGSTNCAIILRFVLSICRDVHSCAVRLQQLVGFAPCLPPVCCITPSGVLHYTHTVFPPPSSCRSVLGRSHQIFGLNVDTRRPFWENAPQQVCGRQARVHGWWTVLHSWLMELEKVEWRPAEITGYVLYSQLHYKCFTVLKNWVPP